MSIAIIDYGAGNLHSAAKAVTRAADSLGLKASVIREANALRDASHIILPGVGAFASCMQGLKAADGMIEALEEAVFKRGAYFLGICVGAQMMLTRGLENGEHQGLGWMEGDVVPITPKAGPEWMQGKPRIPHMGWNTLSITTPHACLKNWQPSDHAYFVHSYHMQCADDAQVLARCDYGGDITACIGRDNLLGTQFHPEKSADAGRNLLEYFVKQ